MLASAFLKMTMPKKSTKALSGGGGARGVRQAAAGRVTDREDVKSISRPVTEKSRGVFLFACLFWI